MCAFAIFVEGILRNNSIKKYFEFGPVFQEEITFENFLIWSSRSHPVQRSKTIYAIFVKSSVRICIWTSGSRENAV